MISLSENAISRVKKLIQADPERLGVRAAVQGGGCSGFQYKLEFVYQELVEERDRIFENEGVKLYVDPKSFLYLMGTEIDFVEDLNGMGFKFVNPNAKRTCGCGESFSV